MITKKTSGIPEVDYSKFVECGDDCCADKEEKCTPCKLKALKSKRGMVKKDQSEKVKGLKNSVNLFKKLNQEG